MVSHQSTYYWEGIKEEFILRQCSFAIKADCYSFDIPNGRFPQKHSATEHMCRMGMRRTQIGAVMSLNTLECDIAQAAQMMVLNALFPVHLLNWDMHCLTSPCVGARKKLLSPSLNEIFFIGGWRFVLYRVGESGMECSREKGIILCKGMMWWVCVVAIQLFPKAQRLVLFGNGFGACTAITHLFYSDVWEEAR